MIAIRPIAPADRAAVIAVIASDATFRPDELAVATALLDGAIAGDPDYTIFVAEVDRTAPPFGGAAGGASPTGESRVAGYICFGPTAMTRSTYDLYWIVVAASARGRGIGRRLIEAVEHAIRARGGGHVRVETSPAEAHGAARAMYARLGYPIAVELAEFYAPGESMITYYKRIAP